MAGVAGPMWRRSAPEGARFLVGLIIGGIGAGIALALPAYLLATAAQAMLPLPLRLTLLAATCVLFGLADVANRTPHVRRQVPQQLIYRLPAGTLGVAWGFDLGLLFTTQKVVSLIWVALAAAILLDPWLATATAAGVVVVVIGAIAVSTIRDPARNATPRFQWERSWQRYIRQASGLAILALAGMAASQAWLAT